jgi:hypothetical protein
LVSVRPVCSPKPLLVVMPPIAFINISRCIGHTSPTMFLIVHPLTVISLWLLPSQNQHPFSMAQAILECPCMRSQLQQITSVIIFPSGLFSEWPRLELCQYIQYTHDGLAQTLPSADA